MDQSLKNWLIRARQEKFAIGAFNAANLEVVKAIVAAAEETQSPVIIEASQGEIGYFGFENLMAIVSNFRESTELPVFTNLDHGSEIEMIEKAIAVGFDMVHFDGSDLEFDENLKTSAQLTALAHEKGILVEIEFEKIQGSSQAYLDKTAEEVQLQGEYTDPDKAAQIISKTGADILAVSIGNLHGVYQTPETIDLSQLEKISNLVPCFLSLHGGSGIEERQLQEAIKLGIGKVNVNTDLRLAYRQTLENVLRGSDEIKIYKFMPPVIGAVQKVVEEKIHIFGSEGKA
ncbi:MAG TPA: class II fructose-bisphosphate aldolase [Candidatus Bathyarchaeia archaeon]|nr:class II fructose-bisphosphate aldolase [Candidatus Bathyarchaeia archaeon]